MLSNISPWQLLIVLAIVIMIFGTKKLRNLGSDLGSAVKGFKNAVKTEDEASGKIEDKPAENNVAAKTTQDAKQKDSA